MKLPVLNVPSYEVKLQSVETPVKFRPFLVKEQKILLIASESKDKKEIANSLIDCLSSCVDNALDVRKLPVFDLIYLFLKVRSKSVGEIVDLMYKCDHKNEDGSLCNQEVAFQINLEELQITIPEGHTQLIKLTDTVGVKMRYPTILSSDGYEDISNPIDKIVFLASHIESIYTEDEVYESVDIDVDEMMNFLDSMNTKQLEDLFTFFVKMPTVEYTQNIVCPKCGTSRSVTLNELDSFF